MTMHKDEGFFEVQEGEIFLAIPPTFPLYGVEFVFHATGYHDAVAKLDTSSGDTPPELSPDTTNNYRDYPIAISYEKNDGWLNSIEAIQYTDPSGEVQRRSWSVLVSERIVQLEPGKIIFRSGEIGTGNIIIYANGYEPTEVYQEIQTYTSSYVSDMIESLPDVENIILDDQDEVNSVISAFNYLTEQEKEEISDSNLSKLDAVKDKIADIIVSKINDLPALQDLTLGDKSEVYEIDSAYDKLTNDQEDIVGEQNQDKMDRSIARIVELMIEELLPIDDLTLADQALINETAAAYDDLKVYVYQNQQQYVSDEHVTNLDQAIAKMVELKIEALPPVEEITLADKQQVQEANYAYYDLYDFESRNQRQYVSEDIKDKLDAALAKIDELQQ